MNHAKNRATDKGWWKLMPYGLAVVLLSAFGTAAVKIQEVNDLKAGFSKHCDKQEIEDKEKLEKTEKYQKETMDKLNRIEVSIGEIKKELEIRNSTPQRYTRR